MLQLLKLPAFGKMTTMLSFANRQMRHATRLLLCWFA